MMKKTSKRMIISVLTLVLTVVALGTTTFAWFSLSTTSVISNIGGDITTGDGLEVKLVRQSPEGTIETQWMSNIDASTFFDSSFRFDAVTTAANNFEFFKMNQGADDNISLNYPATKNTDYLEFEIHLRSQLGGKVELIELEFGGDEVTFTVDGNNYIQYNYDPLPNETSALPVVTSPAYAARISFTEVNTRNIEVSDRSTVYQHGTSNGVLRLNEQQTHVVGNEIMGGNGVIHGQWSYLIDSRGLIIKDPNNSELDYDPTSAVIIPALTSVKDEFDNSVTTVNLHPGKFGGTFYGAVLKVRLWIEGWDADAYDSIYNSNLIVNATFTKQTLEADDLMDVAENVIRDYLNDNNQANRTINLMEQINGFNIEWTKGTLTPETINPGSYTLAVDDVITATISGPNVDDKVVTITVVS